jgi:hypothetical protein
MLTKVWTFISVYDEGCVHCFVAVWLLTFQVKSVVSISNAKSLNYPEREGCVAVDSSGMASYD